MCYGVVILSVVPLRAEASERSEMVSQLLFGDTYQLLEKNGNWLKIKTSDCAYEGWLGIKYHYPLSESQFQQVLQAPKCLVRDFLLLLCDNKTKQLFPVFLGTSFPEPDESGQLMLGDRCFTISNTLQVDAKPTQLGDKQSMMLQFAAKYLRAPYLWGGRTPAGIDCSGFTQLIYKSIGIAIPRDASQQVNLGTIVDFTSEAQIGDLAFFENEEGRIIHVGMICGKDSIIHASGQVRIDNIDETGIFNKDTKQYSHKLRIIKRLF